MITLEDVRRVAQTLPRDKRNARYDGQGRINYETGFCRYSDPTNMRDPSCIVGTIVHGVDPKVFAVIAHGQGSVFMWNAAEQAHFTSGAYEFLWEAQKYADVNHSWGDSIDFAMASVTKEPEPV